MNNPLVSIVVPSFNQAPFLEQCLCSILAQDYPNIEIIVIDGGSTDGSVEIIRRYQDRLAYWVSEPDSGQSHGINKGFLQAQGDIVAWLNSDDVYLPGSASLAVKRFQENPSLSLFYGHCVFIDEQGNFIRYFTEVEPWNKKRLLNYSDFIMQPTTFFPREKLLQVGLLDETLHYGMDWDLWCKLANAGDVHFENEVVAANREYGSTKTSCGGWTRLRELLQIQRRHMTGVWPHAFFGYCSTEFLLKASLTSSFASRLLWRCASMFAIALSPSARMQNRKLYAGKFIYGLKPHSSKVPAGKADIYLPLPDNVTAVALHMGLVPGTKAFVETPDMSMTLSGDDAEVSVLLPVGEKTIAQGFWSANVIFQNEQGAPVEGDIFRSRWIFESSD